MHQDVRTHGAVGDGVARDTQAFQKAIDRCHEQGGGMVSVPPGRYRIGSVRLRSHVRLDIQTGAVVVGSAEEADYERICPTRMSPFPRSMQAMFWADDEDDIAITGDGSIIGGGGQALCGPEYLRNRFRPCIFHFVGCQGVRLVDVTIREAWYWTVHLLRCVDVHVRGVSILNHRQRMASVGVVPDDSSDVIISDCIIEAGDDAVAVKNTEGGVCENVLVANCILRSSQSALKIGAQTTGTIRNVTCTGCIIEDSHVGIGVYLKDGGVIENLSFANLTIRADNEFPITIDATPRRQADPRWGTIRNVHLSDLQVTGRGRCYVQGGPESPIERITFRNVTWGITGYCDGIKAEKNHGSEHIDPDPAWPDYASRQAQFVLGHVRDVQMSQITVHRAVPLERPDRAMLWMRDVVGAILSDMRCPPPPRDTEPMTLVECDDVACAPTVGIVQERSRARTESFAARG